jgi:16S rRNA processing protein RimM
MDLVPVARIGKPRGVRGEVWLDRYWRGFPRELAGQPVWLSGEEGAVGVQVEGFFEYAKGCVLKLKGVDRVESAQPLCGMELLLPRAAVPSQGPDEFDVEEVIGFRVLDRERGEIGRVEAVQERPAYWAFVVVGPGAELEIPAVKGLGVVLDKPGRTLSVDLPEGYPGLPGAGDAD